MGASQSKQTPSDSQEGKKQSLVKNKRVTSSFKDKTLFVIAIDLGTTYSGYAFALRSEPDKIFINSSWNNEISESFKTATCVLVGPHDEFVAFGYDALYSDLLKDEVSPKEKPEDSKKEKPQDYHLFNNFKMCLHGNDNLTKDTMLKSPSGHKTKALKIFGYMIKGLKDHCLERIKKSKVKAPSLDMIQWVLTVPAIWSDTAKDFMRQAACEAGLIKTKDSDLLTIALEPEAAGILCKKEQVKKYTKKDQGMDIPFTTIDFEVSFRINDKYLVIDAGGGTIDITGYQVSKDEEIAGLIIPHGGPWGGYEVDKKFKTFLVDLLGKKFVELYEKEFPQMFLRMMLLFEQQKKIVKPESKNIRINMEYNFGQKYQELHGKTMEEDIQNKKDSQEEFADVSFTNGMLIINNFFERFFKDTIHNIVQHINKLLGESSLEGIRYILLVGGFGQSEILQKAINNILPPSCHLIIPEDAQVAVLKGAVLFGMNPDSVKSRIMTKTYGAGIMRWYDESKHKSKPKVRFHGRDWCDGVFEPFILKGESVKYGDVITKRRTPVQEDQTEMIIDIYCTDKTDFTEDDFVDKPYMQPLGHVIVQMDNVKKNLNQAIMVDFKFGGTEIKVTAWDESSGKKTDTTIAFCL